MNNKSEELKNTVPGEFEDDGKAEQKEITVEPAESKNPLTECEEKITMLENELAKKNEEAKENYDKFLRNLAEFDNYRKRVNKERAEIYRYGCENLIKNMLPMLDNFERAMAATQEIQDFKNFVTGIKMIQSNLADILEKEGLKPISAVGLQFDPHLHDAVMQVETTEASDGTVTEEVLKGYMLNERVLRHSMVKVAKTKENQ